MIARPLPRGVDAPRAVAWRPSFPEDVPVGAVVYDPDGTELAAGRNEREADRRPDRARRDPGAAPGRRCCTGSWRLDGCTLVVTLEPCTMCAGALVLARIATLVFGAWEPKTGAVGSLWDVVRDRRLNHRPEVYSGVLEDECAALVRDFFRRLIGPPPDHAIAVSRPICTMSEKPCSRCGRVHLVAALDVVADGQDRQRLGPYRAAMV